MCYVLSFRTQRTQRHQDDDLSSLQSCNYSLVRVKRGKNDMLYFVEILELWLLICRKALMETQLVTEFADCTQKPLLTSDDVVDVEGVSPLVMQNLLGPPPWLSGHVVAFRPQSD